MLLRLLVLLITANTVAYFWLDYHASIQSNKQKSRYQQIALAQAQSSHQPIHLQSEQRKPPVAVQNPDEAAQCFEASFAPMQLPANTSPTVDQHESALHELASELIQQGGSAQLYWEPTPILQSFLIYLPPAKSAAYAKETVHALKQRGIDAFMFTTGELANGISLGLYSKRDSAMAAIERFTRLGYTARLKERYKLHRWPYLAIVLTLDEQAHDLEQRVQKITGKYSALLITPKPCADVARKAELE